MVKRSFWIPAAVLLLSFAELVGSGKRATKILVENLPTPLNSTGMRVLDLVHPTSAFGRLYDLSFTAHPDAASYPPDVRLRIQLWSNGKTRLIVVRAGHPVGSRRDALRDLARGAARLEIVADRGWLDLGPPPAPGREMKVQLVGLLPGPFGFTELDTPANPVVSRLQIWRPDLTEYRVLSAASRCRIIAPAPVGAGETLARFFFFISISRVLQVVGIAALVLLFVGWRALTRGKAATAASYLIPSVVLLHVVCLPPLQGADETSHVATVEKIVFGEIPPNIRTYPRSISLVAQALELNRVQFHPDEPLPVQESAARERLRELLQQRLGREARQAGPPAPAALIQEMDARSVAFFRPFQILAPGLRPLSVIDRISLYRIVSAIFGLALFGAGVELLRRARFTQTQTLLFAVVMLVPYTVATVASCSNYAQAIGMGAFLAAAALVLILGPEPRSRAIAAALFLAGSWIGIFIWLDFILLAGLGTAILLAWALWRVAAKERRATRPALRWIGVGLLIGLATAGFWILVRNRIAHLGHRVPHVKVQWGSPDLVWMLVTALAPFAIAAMLAWLIWRIGRRPFLEVRQVLRNASIGLAVLFVVAFLVTKKADVPFEDSRLDFPGLVRAHSASFWSNNFSWDQDRLFWKFYWGAFGWHDAFYPDFLYALARWFCVGLFLALPVLCARFIADRPRSSALLVLVCGVVLSFSVVSETMRYLGPSNPWGRFILPYLPLAALPVLIQIEAPGREGAVRLVLAAAVGLQIWTALVVLGSRYVLGG